MHRIGIYVLTIILLSTISASALASEDYKILVVNDDGYDTNGIRALARALAAVGEVKIVGPKTNASGVGHGITYKTAIEYRRGEDEGNIPVYWVDALPASCVRWAIDVLYSDDKPDLVVSGINRGINVGMGVYYSGTVGAAREATFAGVPAVAVSMNMGPESDFEGAAKISARICKEMLRKGKFFFLNINFPEGKLSERTPVEYTTLTKTRWEQNYVERENPRNGQLYFWIVSRQRPTSETDSDQGAIQNGRISITPLMVDVTDRERLNSLRNSKTEEKESELQKPRSWWQQ